MIIKCSSSFIPFMIFHLQDAQVCWAAAFSRGPQLMWFYYTGKGKTGANKKSKKPVQSTSYMGTDVGARGARFMQTKPGNKTGGANRRQTRGGLSGGASNQEHEEQLRGKKLTSAETCRVISRTRGRCGQETGSRTGRGHEQRFI